MTWPEVIYKVVIEGGGTLLSIAVVLYFTSDFWEMVLGRRDQTPSIQVRVVAEEMRQTAKRITAKKQETITNLQLLDWADRILGDYKDEEDD